MVPTFASSPGCPRVVPRWSPRPVMFKLNLDTLCGPPIVPALSPRPVMIKLNLDTLWSPSSLLPSKECMTPHIFPVVPALSPHCPRIVSKACNVQIKSRYSVVPVVSKECMTPGVVPVVPVSSPWSLRHPRIVPVVSKACICIC